MEPAASIIAKFGGNTKLARLIGVTPLWVYRWKRPLPDGTGGRVPHKLVPRVLAAAKAQGIALSIEDIWGTEPAGQ